MATHSFKRRIEYLPPCFIPADNEGTPTHTLEQSTAKIVALHRVLAGELSGAEARNDRVFERAIADRLAAGLYNIQPAGTALLRPVEPSGEWLAVHETWPPEEVLDPSLFAF